MGADGVARVVDFGIAKAVGRLQQTRTGEFKGKFGYAAPEQVNGSPVTRAADIYAVGVVLWEALTGRPLFNADTDVQLAAQVLLGNVSPPSHFVSGVPAVFDDITMCALQRDPASRFATARDMARALETSVPIANASHVAAWVEGLAGPVLRRREQRLADIESDWARRTGAPEIPRSAPPADAQRDASTRAVTYAAGLESGTRVEGQRRGRPGASSFLDSQDRPAPRGALPLGVWVALAAGATIAVAGRRIDATTSRAGSLERAHRGVVWPRRGSAAEPDRRRAPGLEAAVPTAAPSPVVPSPEPATVSVESLPLAAPSSIPIEALPRAVETPTPAPAPTTHRPRSHRR